MVFMISLMSHVASVIWPVKTAVTFEKMPFCQLPKEKGKQNEAVAHADKLGRSNMLTEFYLRNS